MMADDGRDHSRRPGRKITGRLDVQPVRPVAEWGKQKFAGSPAEYLWNRLEAVDFINQGTRWRLGHRSGKGASGLCSDSMEGGPMRALSGSPMACSSLPS
jgi:hypothetical protein